MAHGVGGLNLLSQTLSDHVFLIFCGGIASPFRNAVAFVFHLCSKLEVNDVIKCVRADEAINFSLVRACVARSLRGAALG